MRRDGPLDTGGGVVGGVGRRGVKYAGTSDGCSWYSGGASYPTGSGT